jgi:hypothetical protein
MVKTAMLWSVLYFGGGSGLMRVLYSALPWIRFPSDKYSAGLEFVSMGLFPAGFIFAAALLDPVYTLKVNRFSFFVK